jgi:hypothetical protein
VLPLPRTRYSPGVSSLYGLLPGKPQLDFSALPFLYFLSCHYWLAMVFQGAASCRIGFSFFKITPKVRNTNHFEIFHLIVKAFSLDNLTL